ncbi:CinA family protein [Ureaplasma zalophigenitalium]|uniref:Nicotinamide-nucleotide amidohydrolase family protein n=1 Tax=Ureaplasma zalophigenitalium TaxID=907723 RepID=A0ABT3BPN3_9BACT|nr:nicotinamide-nucleotide amidohydrolase family protein [Ureaplasma zalophigenitalium]MCV3754210.1 nicotinamide-nucleotide amidohydrolase family protein [Ureaplasma zalophigenitalium]
MVKKIKEYFESHKLTLSTCESATCGALASMLAEEAGISSFYKGGIVSYAKETKINLVGVDLKIIEDKGTISAETAKELARKTNQLLNTHVCLSVTGNAGPSGDENKEVGLFYVGVAVNDFCFAKEMQISDKGRLKNRIEMAFDALAYLSKILEK